MNATAESLREASQLIGWAARPKERPARHADYAALVRRYLDDPDFAAQCDRVAAGLGLTIEVDAEVGVVAVADAGSPLRMRLADFMKRTTPGGRRALPGLAVLALARVAYPHPAQLDDAQRVPRVSVAAVVEYLNRLIERIGAGSPDPDADHPENDELWRSWEALRQARSHAERTSIADRTGLVKRVCRFLEDEGHLSPVSGDDGGTWRATQRFRLMVTSMVEDPAVYGAVFALTTLADEYGAGPNA